MGEKITLTAKDGVKIGGYIAHPAGKPKGGVVVIQEIFGVNQHIRKMVDFYASQGYLAVAPALYDRAQPNYESGYTQPEVQAGAAIRGKLDNAGIVADLEAAVAEAAKGGKVGVVGYCFGGTMTYLSACKIAGVSAASAYYGGGACAMAGDKPACPTIMHFGETDHSIPMADVEKFKAARPETPVYVYPAGHGFNCDERGSWHAESAELARKRTLEHFAKNL